MMAPFGGPPNCPDEKCDGVSKRAPDGDEDWLCTTCGLYFNDPKLDCNGRPRKVMVEGVVCRAGPDPSIGEEVNLDGVSWKRFLASGYLTNVNRTRPRVQDIVGIPKSVERDDDEIRMRAEIFDGPTKALLWADQERNRVSMGCAMAGKIKRREGQVIAEMELDSVAILPADQLTDPSCICKIVDEE
jgi:hypothetical protein